MGYVYRYEIFLSWEAINIFRIEKTKVVNGCDCWGRPEYDDVYKVYCNDEFVDDIKQAVRAVNKKTAVMLIQEYERSHDYEKSGFTPILVTEKLTW